MSDNKSNFINKIFGDNENVLLKFLDNAYRLELHSDAGKINYTTTIILLIMMVGITATDVTLTIINAAAYKEKLSLISFKEAAYPLIICTLACITLMGFIGLAQEKIKNEIDKAKK